MCDGSWGCLSGSASLTHLIQRYHFRGEARVSIFLYSSATRMNSLLKLTHQVDAELASMQLAVKDVRKSVKMLQDFNIKLKGGPILISYSQTCLSLCSRPSTTLDLSTSLIVSRVQETFSHANLFYAPGKLFETGVDLLTRYRPKLMSLITNQFFSPDLLKAEIPDRPTVPVADMRKAENLPHLCEKQQVWALMKGSTLAGNLLQQKTFYRQTYVRFPLHRHLGSAKKRKVQPNKELPSVWNCSVK